jgi:hypothetical protein
MHRVLILMLSLPFATAVASHHSWSAYFDKQQPLTVTGTIAKVDWVNPVIFVHVRANDPATGQLTTWAFEAIGVTSMTSQYGLSANMFKEGDRITVIGYRTRPGANLSETVADPELAARVRAETAASAAQFEFADGRKFPINQEVPRIPERD